MSKHYEQEDFARLETATSFEALVDIAITILKRIKKEGHEVVQICGPMSTGGLGNIEDNFAFFRKAIEKAREQGLVVFDQTHFQHAMQRLSQHLVNDEYNMDILEIFYKKVFESGLISKALFLPKWETSKGSCWERDFLSDKSIVVEDYPIEWL